MKPAGVGGKYNANTRSPDFEQRKVGKNLIKDLFVWGNFEGFERLSLCSSISISLSLSLS